MNKIKIHSNTPPKLVKQLHKCGSFHKLADEIEVNVKYVHELITKGIEPTDRTELGREIRAKLFLTKYRRKGKPRRPRQPRPEHLRWWHKQDRDSLIRQLYDLNKDAL